MTLAGHSLAFLLPPVLEYTCHTADEPSVPLVAGYYATDTSKDVAASRSLPAWGEAMDFLNLILDQLKAIPPLTLVGGTFMSKPVLELEFRHGEAPLDPCQDLLLTSGAFRLSGLI